MTDVQRCDACGKVAYLYNNTFDFSTSVADVSVSEDAVDVRQSGHLCDDCAREVAQTIKQLGGGNE